MGPILAPMLRASPRALPLWAGWGLAAGAVCAMALLRLGLFGGRPGWPHLMFVPVVMASGFWVAGGAGYVAAVFASVVAMWAFAPPGFSFASFADPVELTGFCVSLAVNLLVATLAEALHALVADMRDRNRELTEAMRALRRSDAEKAVLLREAAHRTRNDLQRLVSTVATQEMLTDRSADAREAVASARARIEATAAVHARLGDMTANGRSSRVDMPLFLNGLVDDLAHTADPARVAIFTQVESHALLAEQATSIGLIVNEAVTNSLKYAFPGDRRGAIRVGFRRDADGFALTVEDDGVGVPAGATPRGSGLGSKIVRSLAEQLGGSIHLAPAETGGAVCRLRFPADPPETDRVAPTRRRAAVAAEPPPDGAGATTALQASGE